MKPTGGKARAKPRVAPKRIEAFVASLFGDDLHAKRVLSLSNGVVGVMHAAALAIHAIGCALATARGLSPKHAIKQVDRLLSNHGIELADLFGSWAAFVIAARTDIVVAMDWTEFDKDNQSTIAIYMVTSHGRATPLIWKTVYKDQLKDRRNSYEDELLVQLRNIIGQHTNVTRVTVLADRGFGDQALFRFLGELGWDYIIRFRGNILVSNDKGVAQPAKDWMAPTGRAKKITKASVTDQKTPVAAVVVVHDKAMKDNWCMATSRDDLSARQVVHLYGKRFRIEETFRDTKDIHFGAGLSSTRIGRPERRDRLMFLFAIAHALLTLLGAACEQVGLDRMLKANTVKRRTHSLYRQGCYWFGAIPTMDDDRLRALMQAFNDIVTNKAVLSETFGVL